MFAIDTMAYGSPLRQWPPLGKLLLTFALLFASISSPTPLIPLIVLFAGLILLYLSSGFRLPDIMAFACLNTFALISISVLIIAFMTPGTPIWSANFLGVNFSISTQSINLAVSVFIRAIAGFAVLLFFASSTPLPHLFSALRQAGVPDHVAELTILVYRYSFMMLEQLAQMRTAAECRLGYKDAITSFKSSAYILPNLFSRSMDFAERAQSALYCRNFQGSFPTFRQPQPLTAVWVAISIAVFAVLFAAGQLFSNLFVL